MAVGVADVIEVIAEMTLLGQRVLNVWHLLNVLTEVTDEEALDDAAEAMEALYSQVDQIMSASLSFTSVYAKNLDTNTDLGQIDWPTLTAGTIASGAVLPTQVAGLITFPTAVPKVRGRKFIAGIDESVLASGQFNSTATAALVNMATSCLSQLAMTNSNWQYVVVSTNPLVGNELPTEGLVTSVPSALGRRRIGVGE